MSTKRCKGRYGPHEYDADLPRCPECIRIADDRRQGSEKRLESRRSYCREVRARQREDWQMYLKAREAREQAVAAAARAGWGWKNTDAVVRLSRGGEGR